MSGIRRLVRLVPQPVRRRLKKWPVAARAVEMLDLFIKHGHPRPTRMRLRPSGHVVHVDPADPRARAILRDFAHSQLELKTLWNAAINRLQPGVVLDVGANYGEFVFGCDYPQHTQVVAVEANERLVPLLERSRAAHPNARQIRIIRALAAAESAPSMEIHIDLAWSGRSSVVRRFAASEVQRCEAVTVDSLLGSAALDSSPFVFKIDVEGFEAQVLAGMLESLRRSQTVVGIMELNSEFLRLAETDFEAFLGQIDGLFARLYSYHGSQWWPGAAELLERYRRDGRVSTNVAVATENVDLEALLESHPDSVHARTNCTDSKPRHTLRRQHA